MRAAPVLAALFIALSTSACAQFQQAYTPTPFQEGKDVVWVPTPQTLVDKLLGLAKVTKEDFVMDLGSGDGRLVITAARLGARAVGVEYNPDLVEHARRAAEKEGVGERAVFVKADLFETDFSRATVITMFLLPELNMRLRPKILALRPGTRIVSNTFTMGDWLPDETVKLTSADGCSSAYCTGLFWVVPARVEGTHKLPDGEITVTQEYQLIAGKMTTGGRSFPFSGKVRGEAVTILGDGREFRGRMNGRTLELK
jgi:SAM-dependent methyltransferase